MSLASLPRPLLRTPLFDLDFANKPPDYPVCTFPVTFADAALDPVRENWTPLNEFDGKLQADYDPSFYHGTPVTLQCVGRRLEDEKVLEMTGIIAEALKSVT